MRTIQPPPISVSPGGPRYDTNKDGELSMEEFKALAKDLRGSGSNTRKKPDTEVHAQP